MPKLNLDTRRRSLTGVPWRLMAVLAAAIAALSLTTGCSDSDPTATPTPSTNDVSVTLTEFGIQASRASFEAGVEYRFVVKNAGTLPHEFMVMPHGVMDHMQALMEIEQGELAPGATAMHSFTFARSGGYEFACHLPGHYDGGMKSAITVQ